MSLKGARELRARLKAIKVAFKPIGREWAEETVRLARPRVPVLTGRTARSVRVRNASQKRATVVARFPAVFIDRGTKAHDIRARKARRLVFQAGGRTVFAKKVHKRAIPGTHFAERAAREALRNRPMARVLIEQWNRAA